MAWGSSVMTNPARCLWIAYALSGDVKYRRAAILNTDFMLGANPMGMSWTTGTGYVYPVNIQHEISETDAIMDPVPGITVYGITDGISQVLRQNAWQSPKDATRKEFVAFVEPEVPLWRRWSSHPTMNTPQCEFTIQETMSSTIFCCSQLLGEAWMPTAELKESQPAKKELLFGYWYLP
jgi:endoglucanase